MFFRASNFLKEAEGHISWEGQTINSGVYIHGHPHDHCELVQRWPADLCFIQIQHYHNRKLLYLRVSQHWWQGGCRKILLPSVQRCWERHVWGSGFYPRLVQDHWTHSVWVHLLICSCKIFLGKRPMHPPEYKCVWMLDRKSNTNWIVKRMKNASY